MNILRASSTLLLFAGLALATSAHAQSDEATSDLTTDATPLTTPTSLVLLNGWTNAPYGTNKASIEVIGGIAHFKGAIATAGTNPEPFVLPKAFRPSHTAFIPIDLCNATNGRLIIETTGVVAVESEGSFSNAQCFTSLDGASFAVKGGSFKPLSTINGWTSGPFGTSTAQLIKINGIVHFRGAIATTGTNNEAFVLPSGYRPAQVVYVPVDMCDSTNGRLIISPNGIVSVQSETSFSNAQCFTSLDGAWFVEKDSGFKTLSLTNGWVDTVYETSKPKAIKSGGVVYFQGAAATDGTNTEPFTLPSSMTPEKTVYVPVDLCGATKGRLIISTNGVVSVEAEKDFSSAQCFTSLEGVSFVY